MKRITIGDVTRELRLIFPYLTEDMVRQDAEAGTLPTFPRFNEKSWWYVNPDGLRDYVIDKTAGKAPEDKVCEVLKRLGLNFIQGKLKLSA